MVTVHLIEPYANQNRNLSVLHTRHTTCMYVGGPATVIVKMPAVTECISVYACDRKLQRRAGGQCDEARRHWEQVTSFTVKEHPVAYLTVSR